MAAREQDGKRVPQVTTVEPSDELIAFVHQLGDRANQVRLRAVSGTEDNLGDGA